MRKFVRSLVLVPLLALVCLSVVFAHPGKTDADGGHYNRSTGEYHYHHGYRSTNIRTASVRMTSTIRPELTAALRPQAPVPTCRLCGGRILPKSRRIHPANLM